MKQLLIHLAISLALALPVASVHAQTGETAPTRLQTRAAIATPLFAMQARAHTDNALGALSERFEWSSADKFIIGAPRRANFVYKLPTNNGHGTGAVIWSRPFAQASRAKPNDDSIGLERSDGFDYGGLAGVEWHDTRAMFGAAVGYQSGRQNFTSVPEFAGSQRAEVASAYAYGAVGAGHGPRLWVVSGYGDGGLRYHSGMLVQGARADVSNLFYGVGIRMPVGTGIRNKLAVNSSIVRTRFTSKSAVVPAVAGADGMPARAAVVLLPALRTNYVLGRAAMDANLYFDGSDSAFWWARLNAGFRYEAGDLYRSGLGVDFMTSLAVQTLHGGLTAKLYLRAVYMLTNENYNAVGGGLELSYDPGGDGRGFAFMLRPQLGGKSTGSAAAANNNLRHPPGSGIHFVVSWRR